MSDLRIDELLLLSIQEHRAKRVPFNPETTLVLGNNDTGKSSILKSIYDTLGAAPAKTHQRWTAANVISLLRFTLGAQRYAILKADKLFALFHDDTRPIATFTSITNEFGPYLGELLSFSIKLTSRDGKVVTPPPAYLFLPFYIDQDVGWVNNWSSFANLGQLRNWRKSIAEYHTGIKPNEYYLAKAAKEQVEQALQTIGHELHALQQLRTHAQRHERPTFSLSLADFQHQIDPLIAAAQDLGTLEHTLKEELRELQDARTLVQTKISVVEHAMQELSADYQFATAHVTDETVSCPTCGAIYENGFRERFKIAEDEDRLQDLLIELRQEQRTILAKISEQRAAFTDNRTELDQLRALLQTQQQAVTLQTILQSEGRREVDAILEERISAVTNIRNDRLGNVEHYRQQLRAYEDTYRQSEIVNEYQGLMRRYLPLLSVEHLGEGSYARIDANIKEIGSDLPRALLAYYFSILHVMRRHSTSTYCPIVIDSPNQQGQDPQMLPTMLRFIRDHRPKGTQLILSLENTAGIDFGGTTVELTHKNQLLQESEFDDVKAEIWPRLRAALEQTGEPPSLF